MAIGRVSAVPATAPLAVVTCDWISTTLLPQSGQGSAWSHRYATTALTAGERRDLLRSPSRHAFACVLSWESKKERQKVSTAPTAADVCSLSGEEVLERVRREVCKGSDDDISVEIRKGMAAGDTDAAHAGGTSSRDTSGSILHDNGSLRGYAQLRSSGEKDLRVWLPPLDVLFANDGIERVV